MNATQLTCNAQLTFQSLFSSLFQHKSLLFQDKNFFSCEWKMHNVRTLSTGQAFCEVDPTTCSPPDQQNYVKLSFISHTQKKLPIFQLYLTLTLKKKKKIMTFQDSGFCLIFQNFSIFRQPVHTLHSMLCVHESQTLNCKYLLLFLPELIHE